MTSRFQPEKLKAALTFLLSQSRLPAPGGMDELCRVLWYADCQRARQTGQSITGATYTVHAMTPHTRSLGWAVNALIAEGAICGGRDYLSYEQADLRLLRPCHTTALSDDERITLQDAYAIVFKDRLGGGRLAVDDFRECMLDQAAVSGGTTH
jgi:hypothetical protein